MPTPVKIKAVTYDVSTTPQGLAFLCAGLRSTALGASRSGCTRLISKTRICRCISVTVSTCRFCTGKLMYSRSGVIWSDLEWLGCGVLVAVCGAAMLCHVMHDRIDRMTLYCVRHSTTLSVMLSLHCLYCLYLSPPPSPFTQALHVEHGTFGKADSQRVSERDNITTSFCDLHTPQHITAVTSHSTTLHCNLWSVFWPVYLPGCCGADLLSVCLMSVSLLLLLVCG